MLVTYDLPSSQPWLEIAGGLKRSLWRYERFIPVISAQLVDTLDDPHTPIPGYVTATIPLSDVLLILQNNECDHG